MFQSRLSLWDQTGSRQSSDKKFELYIKNKRWPYGHLFLYSAIAIISVCLEHPTAIEGSS